jgi:uncharacterized protein
MPFNRSQNKSRSAAFSLLGLTCLLPATIQADQQSQSPLPSITVRGDGVSNARPDVVEIRAGVATQMASAAEALRSNSAAMTAVTDVLRQRGVEEKDMKTSSFRIQTVRLREQKQGNAAQTNQYRVTSVLHVTIRDIARVGVILDEIVQAGANELGQIQFRLADSTKIQDEARHKAIADAKRKAQLYADASDVQLARIIQIQENPTARAEPQSLFSFNHAEPSTAAPIAAGELEVRASVTVTFAIAN